MSATQVVAGEAEHDEVERVLTSGYGLAHGWVLSIEQLTAN